MGRRVDGLGDLDGLALSMSATGSPVVMLAESCSPGGFEEVDAVGDAMPGPVVLQPIHDFLSMRVR